MRAVSLPAGAGLPRTLLPRRLLALAGDDRLVEQIRRGNEAAFEVVYERYSAGLLGFCRHMLGSPEEAEEAVQHTLAAAYRQLRRDEREIQLKPWLYTIARNRCLSLLRARREQASDDLEERELATVGLDQQVQARADLRELLTDLAELPDDQRAALLLAELGALSHAEVAEVLGCEGKQVRGLVFRARSGLLQRREARETPCEDIREQLANLRGGSLRRSGLRHHLSGCAGCRAFREQLQDQRSMLAAALPVAASAKLKASVFGAAGLSSGSAGSGVAGGGAVGSSGVLGGGAGGGGVAGGLGSGLGGAATTAAATAPAGSGVIAGTLVAKVAIAGGLLTVAPSVTEPVRDLLDPTPLAPLSRHVATPTAEKLEVLVERFAAALPTEAKPPLAEPPAATVAAPAVAKVAVEEPVVTTLVASVPAVKTPVASVPAVTSPVAPAAPTPPLQAAAPSVPTTHFNSDPPAPTKPPSEVTSPAVDPPPPAPAPAEPVQPAPAPVGPVELPPAEPTPVAEPALAPVAEQAPVAPAPAEAEPVEPAPAGPTGGASAVDTSAAAQAPAA